MERVWQAPLLSAAIDYILAHDYPHILMRAESLNAWGLLWPQSVRATQGRNQVVEYMVLDPDELNLWRYDRLLRPQRALRVECWRNGDSSYGSELDVWIELFSSNPHEIPALITASHRPPHVWLPAK